MRAVTTAGERVLVDCAVGWLSTLLAEATAGELAMAAASDETVRLEIQAGRRPFDRGGLTPIGRGTWAAPPRALIVDACLSRVDLHVQPPGPGLQAATRFRPSPRTLTAHT